MCEACGTCNVYVDSPWMGNVLFWFGKHFLLESFGVHARVRSPNYQVKVPALLGVGLLHMDADPPRYEARRATSWLVLFITHCASCGAGAVIKNANELGAEFVDATDAHFRQKLAKRLGMAQHSADADVSVEAWI